MKRIFTLFASLTFFSWISHAQITPTLQAFDIVAAPISGSTTSLLINWSAGNGTSHLVLMRSSSGSYNLTDGATIPTANPNYNTAAADLDGFNATGGRVQVVFNGAGTSVPVTNLNPLVEYIYFAVPAVTLYV